MLRLQYAFVCSCFHPFKLLRQPRPRHTGLDSRQRTGDRAAGWAGVDVVEYFMPGWAVASATVHPPGQQATQLVTLDQAVTVIRRDRRVPAGGGDQRLLDVALWHRPRLDG